MVELKVPIGSGRVARYLLKTFPNLQYSAVQKALRDKDIKLNGKRLTEDISLLEGDVLQIYLPDAILYGKPKPDIAYEDDNIAVVNKKPGMEISGEGQTLQTLVTQYLNEPAYPCHRLDVKTGGLVLFAKTKGVYTEILRAFRQNEIHKRYVCIVKGTPAQANAELQAYLLKDSRRSTVRIMNKPLNNAQPITTRYKILASKGEFSLLDVELITARTHQIRAHLAHIGHPILGDDKYGDRAFNRKYKVHEHVLWVTRLKFTLRRRSRLSYLNNRTIATSNYQLPLEI